MIDEEDGRDWYDSFARLVGSELIKMDIHSHGSTIDDGSGRMPETEGHQLQFRLMLRC